LFQVSFVYDSTLILFALPYHSGILERPRGVVEQTAEVTAW
jgi:hypothetical protein